MDSLSQKIDALQKENKEIHELKARIDNLEKINKENTSAFAELSNERSDLKKTNAGLKTEISKYQSMMRNMDSSRMPISPEVDIDDSFEFAGVG
jgi:chromosome segregation ATPase